MAIVSLAEAAKLAGVSRQTIYRKAKNGELSTAMRHDATKGVDTSELQRVFGTITVQEPGVTGVTVTGTVTSDTVRQADTGHATALESELSAARATIRLQEERLEELKADKARLWDQVESQRLLLEHQSTEKPPPAPTSNPLGEDIKAFLILMAIGATAGTVLYVFG